MLQSMGFQRVGHDLVTEKQQQLKKKSQYQEIFGILKLPREAVKFLKL